MFQFFYSYVMDGVVVLLVYFVYGYKCLAVCFILNYFQFFSALFSVYLRSAEAGTLLERRSSPPVQLLF